MPDGQKGTPELTERASEPTRTGRFARAAGVAGARRRLPRLLPPPTPLAVDLPLGEAVGDPVSLRRDAVRRRLLALADALAVLVGLLLVVLEAPNASLAPLAAPVAMAVTVLAARIAGLYDDDPYKLRPSTLDEVPRLAQLAICLTLAAWLTEDFTFQSELGKVDAVVLFIVLVVALVGLRASARLIARWTAVPERCVVLGDHEGAEYVRRQLGIAGDLRVELVGWVAASEQPSPPNSDTLPWLGDYSLLGLVAAQQDVERVIVAPPSQSQFELLDAIRVAKSIGLKVSVLPRLFEVIGSSVRLDQVGGVTLLSVPRHGLSRSSRLIKRLFDLTLAGALTVLLAPLWLTIAIAVRLGSRGPVYFRQTRIGAGGDEFQMLKFRSMVEDAEERKDELLELNEREGLFKISDDPRITRAGTVLRRFSLDELPQLWNVLRGDMSLVGPRPLVPDEECQIDGFERRRRDLPPGMTGPWQVLGSSEIPLQEMAKLDYLYGANWSPWLDIKLLIRTAAHVVQRRGS